MNEYVKKIVSVLRYINKHLLSPNEQTKQQQTS